MNITVLGCGALGKVWLAALSKQGHNVQGWLRVQKLTFNINLIDLHGQENQFWLPANNIIHLAKSDILLVTLKAQEVAKTVQTLLPQLKTNCTIVLLHNGLGTREELPFLIQPLIVGITTHAAYRKKAKTYHIYSGKTFIGPGNSQAKKYGTVVVEVLQNALPEVLWCKNIFLLSWMKLAVNCSINPLTAIYNCYNGELKSRTTEIKAVCKEVAMVMRYEGYSVHYSTLLTYINQVIFKTANNISSMLQDVKKQKLSEIDYINGHILKRAKIHGLSVPENERLFNLIKKKEESYEKNSSSLCSKR